jgi:hypothetical protein
MKKHAAVFGGLFRVCKSSHGIRIDEWLIGNQEENNLDTGIGITYVTKQDIS